MSCLVVATDGRGSSLHGVRATSLVADERWRWLSESPPLETTGQVGDSTTLFPSPVHPLGAIAPRTGDTARPRTNRSQYNVLLGAVVVVEKIFRQTAKCTDSSAYIRGRRRGVEEGGLREDRMHRAIHVEVSGEPPRAEDLIRRGHGRT